MSEYVLCEVIFANKMGVYYREANTVKARMLLIETVLAKTFLKSLSNFRNAVCKCSNLIKKEHFMKRNLCKKQCPSLVTLLPPYTHHCHRKIPDIMNYIMVQHHMTFISEESINYHCLLSVAIAHTVLSWRQVVGKPHIALCSNGDDIKFWLMPFTTEHN